MKIHRALIKEGKTSWIESHKVPEGEDPFVFISKVVYAFNLASKTNYKLIRVCRMRKSEVLHTHEWEKASLVTEKGGYDKMRCKNCRATGKRYGLQSNVVVDKKFDPIYCTNGL